MIIYNPVWLNVFITLFDSTEETFGKKLLFEVEKIQTPRRPSATDWIRKI
jgi:hypothetical protein